VLSSQAASARRSANSGESSAVERQINDLEKRLARATAMQLNPGVPSSRQAKLLPLQVQQQSLQRDLEEARERLNEIEQKRLQASVAASLESSADVGLLSVLDPAYLPAAPVTDLKKKLAMLGLAAAMFLAIGFALMRAMTDDHIFDRSDILQMTSHPVLVVVPRGRAGRARG
jgi:uncharacterized protein involved in exopolysaccharide biosynthesis